MSSMKETAEKFFDACETGKGWEVCQRYCHPGATFSAQVGVLADVKTIEGYTNWMKGLFTPVPDASYEVRSFGVDEAPPFVLAPLVPSFMERAGPSHFIVRAGTPIYVDRSRPRDEAVQAAAQNFADQLATRVRAHPEFWYHFYR